MYRIFADDTLIYDSTLDDYKIAKGSITLEVNKSGSFTFSIYPDHFYYDRFVKLKTVITVYKSGKIVFRGRILNDVTDHWNNKTITCEGELGFLQDSIIRPFTFSGTPEELFKKFIIEHNAQVDVFKQFKIGKVTVKDSNNYIARSNSAYESSLSNLNSRLIEDSLGGYFYITHGDDGTEITPTINYLADFTKKSSQVIEFGVNLKNFTKNVKAESLCTVVIPLGYEIDDKNDETENKRLTIADVNNGKDYVCSEEGLAIYGWICRVVQFDDVTDPKNLKAKGEEYVQNNAKQNISIELNAVDLHLLNPKIESINYGEYVQAVSKPHNFDATLLCTKQTLDLLRPDNDSYTLGYNYSSLTESTAKLNSNLGTITSNYVTNQRFNSAFRETSSLIEQTEESVLIKVDGYLTNFSDSISAELDLKIGTDDSDKIISMINASADVITLNSNRLVINSDNFTLTENGTLTSTNGVFENCTVTGSFTNTGTFGVCEIKRGCFDTSKNGFHGSFTPSYLQFDINNKGLMIQVYETGQASIYGTNLIIKGVSSIEGDESKDLKIYGYGTNNRLYGSWFTSDSVAISSDVNLKNNITDIPDRYGVFFDNLRPVIYKYNDGRSERYHIGFIAQEVDEALKTAGLTRGDFAGLCVADEGTDKEYWGLRYSEFISLITHEIQKFKKEITEIKSKIGG